MKNSGVTSPPLSLSITTSGKLDLTNNKLTIHYGANPSPAAQIRGYLISGRNGGLWNGVGIDSSVAAVTPDFSIGYADGADGIAVGLLAGDVKVSYAITGDINLDGLVNGVDFTRLVTKFGSAVTRWTDGDLNYDGLVNGADFTALVTNFGANSGTPLPAPVLTSLAWSTVESFVAANGLSIPTSVPEPVTPLLVLGAGVLLRRRRR